MLFATLLPRVLNMSITGSIVIVFLLIVRPVLKKTPRIFTYCLWFVALFRLLCPVTLSADFSVLNAFDLPVTESASIAYIPDDIVSIPFPKVNFLMADATELVNANLPQGWDQVEEKPLAESMAVATVVWMIGFYALLTVSIISLRKLCHNLKRAILLRENIYTSDHLETPIVMGLLLPRIYIPSALSRDEQDYVLLHEDHHIRRGDHVAKLISFAALCVHWFNPLVWLAFRFFEQDMEMSCDEAVVQNLDQNMRCDYSQTLLRLSTGTRITAGGPLCFSEGDPKGRIQNILRWKRPGRLTWITATAVCLLLGASLITDPVFAQDIPQPFAGRIHLNLPEGYDYILLNDALHYGEKPTIVIYNESAEHAIADGCISLHHTGEVPPQWELWNSTTRTLRNNVQVQVLEEMSNAFYSLAFVAQECGTVMIHGHNAYRWTEADVDIFREIIGDITVTGPVPYELVELNGGKYLEVSAGELENYGLWTDEGYFCVDLAGASGEAVINLYEAYTDKLVESFVTNDASRNDYHIFSGLTARKEYYLTVSCDDSVTVTIFQ